MDAPAGFLVAAANPYRPLDVAYLGFIALIAGQIASGLASAAPTKRSGGAPRRWRRSTAPRRSSFPMSVTSFARLSPSCWGRSKTFSPGRGDSALDDHRALVQVAHRNGVRLLKLVNTLLDFSRIEADRMHADFEPVDLAAFTAELASSFRSTMERAGLRFDRRLPAVARDGLCQPRHVGKSDSEPVVERVQIHL